MRPIDRVQQYLYRRKEHPKLDQEFIHTLDAGDVAEANLRVPDLWFLVEWWHRARRGLEQMAVEQSLHATHTIARALLEDGNPASARKCTDEGVEGSEPVHSTQNVMIMRQLAAARMLLAQDLNTVHKGSGMSIGLIRSCEGEPFMPVRFEDMMKLSAYYETHGVIFIRDGVQLARKN